MLSNTLIREHLNNTLTATDFSSLGKKYQGKVRDNYSRDGRRVIIVTDRLSAFDRVLGTIPFKGQVLNQLTAFWFEKTRRKVPNHLLSVPDPNVMVTKLCEPLPIEMVVRAYITGVTTTSAWYNYQKGVRNFCGNLLPDGLRRDQKLDMPILTPSTKAAKGGHDESVSKQEILRRGLVSEEEFNQMAEMSFRLFELGQRHSAKIGLILADTKYEFGRDAGGNIIVIDEIHTPDSSRYWHADGYETRFEQGAEQRTLDKEYVRRWLAGQGFIGVGEVPTLTPEVRVEAARRYITAYEAIANRRFEVLQADDILRRIRMSLEQAGLLEEQ